METQLDEQAIFEILKRAEQIHHGNTQSPDSEANALLKAAEEAGLPREAVEQALRERLSAAKPANAPGSLVFAPSSDGKLYVAKVVSSTGKIHAQFLNGGETTCSPDQTVPFTIQPGDKVEAVWPIHNWHSSAVVKYDEAAQTVRLADGWGFQKTFAIADIRIKSRVTAGAKFAQFLNASKGYLIGAAGMGVIWMIVALIVK